MYHRLFVCLATAVAVQACTCTPHPSDPGGAGGASSSSSSGGERCIVPAPPLSHCTDSSDCWHGDPCATYRCEAGRCIYAARQPDRDGGVVGCDPGVPSPGYWSCVGPANAEMPGGRCCPDGFVPPPAPHCIEPMPMAGACSSDADCDDHNACTREACVSGHCAVNGIVSTGACTTPWGPGACQEGSCCPRIQGGAL